MVSRSHENGLLRKMNKVVALLNRGEGGGSGIIYREGKKG